MLPKRPRVSRLAPPLVLLALAALPRISAADGGGPDGTWSSLDGTANAPSIRREYVSVFDQQRDRYLIFGGAGRDRLSGGAGKDIEVQNPKK